MWLFVSDYLCNELSINLYSASNLSVVYKCLRLLSTLTQSLKNDRTGCSFTLKIEAFELSFRDTKWDGLSTVINILARKDVTVQRRKFVMARSTYLDCGSLKCINQVDPWDCHFG